MGKETGFISEIGEFELIDRLKNILPGIDNSDVLVGIGDDTAVIKVNEEESWLVTCDIQIEDRHFRQKHTTFYQLGKRAMAVNLSDIAAMGGDPCFALVSLGLPPDLRLTNYDALFEGMRDQLAEYNANIIGGNLAKSEEKLIIDITLIGKIKTKNVVQRKGANIGDQIFVTGVLGESGAGLALLEKFGDQFPNKYQHLVDRHLAPRPQVAIGKQLASQNLVSAMIDLSDGLASDLNHICKMNQVGAHINFKALPFSRDVEEVSQICGVNLEHLVLHSGEDYQLLFTVNKSVPISEIENIAKKEKVPVTAIGTIGPLSSGYILTDLEGNMKNLNPQGWDHFKKSGNKSEVK